MIIRPYTPAPLPMGEGFLEPAGLKGSTKQYDW